MQDVESKETGSITRTTRLVMAGLIAVCLLIYAQVLGFSFINFDDNLYVFENPFVTSGLTWTSIKWAFTTFHSANWHPLTWISHMIDVTLFGANAGAHHFMNVLFHAANSILAFAVFRQLTGDVWKSAVVAFLFAVHPAHVESVAWVSERKDVLSTLFWLLAMWAYVRFARSHVAEASVLKRMFSVEFLFVFVFVALGLMAKPMLVTLPFVLLLLDFWPLERMRSTRDGFLLALEKAPIFVLSGISAYITVLAQGAYGAIQSTQVLPLDVRILNAIVSYAKYIAMLFYPADLGVGYAYQFPFPVWHVAAAIALLAAITGVCLWQCKSRRYLLVGWLWFLGTMIPVSGLVQVGAQSMADRYTYIPYFGLFIMIVWSAAELVPRLKLNFASTVVLVAVPIAAMTVAAFNQASYWRDPITLYTHTIATGRANFLVMHNLCSVLVGHNRLPEAEQQCRSSIAADPGFPESHILLGVIQVRTGRNDEAIASFKRALVIDPNNAMALGNIAVPLALKGQTDEAEENLNRAVEVYRARGIDPISLANSYSNLAAVFAQQKRFDKAAVTLERVLELAPERADARANYALALYLQNNISQARTEIERSLAQNPNVAESQNILGMILLKQNDRAGAVTAFQRALQIKPDLKEARENLERANAGN